MVPKAAEQGIAARAGQYCRVPQGPVSRRERLQGADWYLRATEQGMTTAQTPSRVPLPDGGGCAPRPGNRFAWLRRAAEPAIGSQTV